MLSAPVIVVVPTDFQSLSIVDSGGLKMEMFRVHAFDIGAVLQNISLLLI